MEHNSQNTQFSSAATGGFRLESIVSIDERGQMVLPKEIRERAGLRAGDKLLVTAWESQGRVLCISLLKAEELQGFVRELLEPMAQHLLDTPAQSPLKDEFVAADMYLSKIKPYQSSTSAFSGELLGAETAGTGPGARRRVPEGMSRADSVFRAAYLDWEEAGSLEWVPLRPGLSVLELGCGRGGDCLVAAQRVGSGGCVLGVDPSPVHIEEARQRAKERQQGNAEFRLGELDHLPSPDASVDLVIANCTINLSPDWRRVIGEAFRVLRPGGCLAIADIVSADSSSADRSAGQNGGSDHGGIPLKEVYLKAIGAAGFAEVEITQEGSLSVDRLASNAMVQSLLAVDRDLDLRDLWEVAAVLRRVTILAVKPGGASGAEPGAS